MQVVLQDVSKVYTDANSALTVLDRVSYTFPAQRSVAIVGKSGIGKSTLLHLLGSLDLPTSGSILYDGQAINHEAGNHEAGNNEAVGSSYSDSITAKWRGKNVGFIFQFHHLLPDFSALENVAMPLLIQGVDSKVAFAKAEQLLVQMELGARLYNRPSMLSGGEQQRVAIARAVVHSPKLLLADEPTGNLDQKSAERVLELMLTLQRELGSSLVIVTHSRELAAMLDITVEMQAGGTLVELSNRRV